MIFTPTTRSKIIEQTLKKKAIDGNFSTRMLLFPDEARMLQKKENGFHVEYNGSSENLNEKKKYHFDIFWTQPFKDETPQSVYEYLIQRTDCFPDVETFAQRLYVFAMEEHGKNLIK